MDRKYASHARQDTVTMQSEVTAKNQLDQPHHKMHPCITTFVPIVNTITFTAKVTQNSETDQIDPVVEIRIRRTNRLTASFLIPNSLRIIQF